MVTDAIIVGGGIAGLAAAIALGMRGTQVRVLEQAPQISEVGAGLQISPNGLAVLRALEVEPLLIKSGAVQAQAVVLADYRRPGEVTRLDLGRLRDQRYFFVHRSDLIQALETRARELGVDISLGCTVRGIKGGAVQTGAGDERAALIVGADGLHSVVRSHLNGAAAPFFTGQVAWRAVVDTPLGCDAPEARVTMGPGAHIVSYPLRGGVVTNLVAVQERNQWTEEGWSHRGNPEQLRENFALFRGPARALLDRVENVHVWGLFRHRVAECWHKEGIALIGDAAHPTLPFMAQGANLALEDAWVLGAHGAEKFQNLRRKRVVDVVQAANVNARRYHLREGPMRWAAHRALGLGGRFAPEWMMRRFDWIYGVDVTKS
jgi:salicylate hydroxylase